MIKIHKKKDQQQCINYGRLNLLNTTCKIISPLRRLINNAGSLIGQHQSGFIRGKLTTGALHIIRQTREKAHEYQIEMEPLFIDFKPAFNSIQRKRLLKALKDMGISTKLRKLIKKSVKTQKGETVEFETNKEVRQEDSLSAVLLIFVLEHVLRKIHKPTVMVPKNRTTLKEMLK